MHGRRRRVARRRRADRARARPGDEPALRRVLRGRAAGGLPADRRRERRPAGGLRDVRPDDPVAAAGSAPRVAYLRPVAEPPEPATSRLPPLRHADRLRGDAGGRRRGGRPGRRPRGRGDPLRRRDQLAAAPAALRGRQRGGARGARRRRRPRPARRRREPAGPPRGLRPVRVEAARLARARATSGGTARSSACAGSCSRTARARRTTSRRAASSARTTTSPTRT